MSNTYTILKEAIQNGAEHQSHRSEVRCCEDFALMGFNTCVSPSHLFPTSYVSHHQPARHKAVSFFKFREFVRGY